MNFIDTLRNMRSHSRMLRGLHSVLRGPYYSMLELLFPQGVRTQLPGSHRVKLHPRLMGMRPSEYECAFSAVLDRYVGTGMTVLDIGAHVGLHTLRLCKLVGDNGRVLAVEPSPANALLLRRHLAWNNCNNVDVIEAAVGNSYGEFEFSFRPDPTDPGGFANSIAYEIGGAKAQIRMTMIDAICQGMVPDIIKIDVEGAELLAVRGARETLRNASPLLFVAVHPDAMAALGTSPADLVKFLEEFGYSGRHLDGRPVLEPGFEEIVFEKGSTYPD